MSATHEIVVPAEGKSPDPRVAAVLAGDRRAAEALLGELLPRARNLIRYLLRGDEDVDDVAQEALIAVMRGLPGYRGDGALKAWVDRVVVRVALAWIRRARRERAQTVVVELSLVPDTGARPDEYAARREVVLLLDQISDEQRHVMVLHHVVGMSVPEVATHLQVPFETVRSRLRLGQANLRALAQRGEDKEP